MSIIVKDPDILGGEPVFRGTRVPFQTLLDYLEYGKTLHQFLDEFPTVTAMKQLLLRRRKQLSSPVWSEVTRSSF